MSGVKLLAGRLQSD